MNMLSLASQQHSVLQQRILSDDPSIDEVTLADTLEGLTDFHEMLAAIVRWALLDEALAAGLGERIGEMQRRHERLQARAATRRAIARDAMVDAEIKKITAPDFTVSIRPGSPSLVVFDEAA